MSMNKNEWVWMSMNEYMNCFTKLRAHQEEGKILSITYIVRKYIVHT